MKFVFLPVNQVYNLTKIVGDTLIQLYLNASIAAQQEVHSQKIEKAIYLSREVLLCSCNHESNKIYVNLNLQVSYYGRVFKSF